MVNDRVNTTFNNISVISWRGSMTGFFLARAMDICSFMNLAKNQKIIK
jgi:hypothetical protein